MIKEYLKYYNINKRNKEDLTNEERIRIKFFTIKLRMRNYFFFLILKKKP
jgi:hypothetical protein